MLGWIFAGLPNENLSGSGRCPIPNWIPVLLVYQKPPAVEILRANWANAIDMLNICSLELTAGAHTWAFGVLRTLLGPCHGFAAAGRLAEPCGRHETHIDYTTWFQIPAQTSWSSVPGKCWTASPDLNDPGKNDQVQRSGSITQGRCASSVSEVQDIKSCFCMFLLFRYSWVLITSPHSSIQTAVRGRLSLMGHPSDPLHSPRTAPAGTVPEGNGTPGGRNRRPRAWSPSGESGPQRSRQRVVLGWLGLWGFLRSISNGGSHLDLHFWLLSHWVLVQTLALPDMTASKI